MFAILFEVLLIEIQEEIHHFAGWEGGVKGHESFEQKFCEQTGVPYFNTGGSLGYKGGGGERAPNEPPKGPSRTKNTTDSKFTIRYGDSKTLH